MDVDAIVARVIASKRWFHIHRRTVLSTFAPSAARRFQDLQCIIGVILLLLVQLRTRCPAQRIELCAIQRRRFDTFRDSGAKCEPSSDVAPNPRRRDAEPGVVQRPAPLAAREVSVRTRDPEVRVCTYLCSGLLTTLLQPHASCECDAD